MVFQGFDLPPELRDLAGLAGEFVRDQIVPRERALAPDARGLPEETIVELRRQARPLGLWCLDAPVEYGGGGLSAFEMSVVTEQTSKHTFSFPIPGAGVFGVPPPPILYSGSPDQIERYVRPTIEHGWRSFVAITEPSGGSDPARSIRTTATRKGDTYRISGRKMWITHAERARYGIVYARTDQASGRDGISAFIVDADTPGMTVRPLPVIRDLWTNEVTFDECEVPAENLIGAEGEGFRLAQSFLCRVRIHCAVQAIAVAEESLRLAVEYAGQRETFGALLAQRQAVQFSLADARLELNAARHLVWDAAHKHDTGQPATVAASMAKLYATEVSYRTVDAMMQVFGGMGMSKELPLEHWFRDMRVARVVEGPNEIHRYVIARDLLGTAATGRKRSPEVAGSRP